MFLVDDLQPSENVTKSVQLQILQLILCFILYQTAHAIVQYIIFHTTCYV